MEIELLIEELPESDKDIRLNLAAVCSQSELSAQETEAVVYAVGCATGSFDIVRILDEMEWELSDEKKDALEAIASVMNQNNIYYRTLHLLNDEALRNTPAKLRMNVLRSPLIDAELVELCSFAISALNGCGMCLESHLHQLREKGVGNEKISALIRIAAVFGSVAKAYEI